MRIKLTELGAVADAREVRDGVMTANSAVLSSQSANFTPDDVGKIAAVLGRGPGGSKLIAAIASFVSASQVILATAASSSGSALEVAYGTNCGPALQAGFSALSSNRGGVLEIDGLFVLATAVSLSFGGETDTAACEIVGTGTDSGVYIAVPPAADAMSFSSGEFLLSDVHFVGSQGPALDARRIISITNGGLVLQRCGFHGLSTSQAPVTVISAGLRTEDCRFGGTISSNGGTVIDLEDWGGYSDRGTQIIDYAHFRGRYYGHGGLGGNTSWIRAGNPLNSAGARGPAVFRMVDTSFDEGSLHGIVLKPTTRRIPYFHLDGVRMNVSSADSRRGMNIEKVDSVVVERCRFGLSSAPSLVGHFQDCKHVLLDSLVLEASVNGISGTNVESLTLKDTPGVTRAIFTNVGFRPVDSRFSPYAIIKKGAVSDADFLCPPVKGTLGLDETLGQTRLYTNRLSGGGWLYAPLGGGDGLGTERVVNGGPGSNTNGWTPSTGAQDARLSIEGGYLQVANEGAGVNGAAYQGISVVPGRRYRLTMEYGDANVGSIIRLGNSAGQQEHASFTSSQPPLAEFTASHPTVWLALILNGSSPTHYARFRNISLREI